MTSVVIDSVPHDRLTTNDLAGLRELFHAEYSADLGVWNPDQPYGYAPHDLHTIARLDDAVVGHVGWARRTISVGAAEVVIAGVGGVLIAPQARGERVGAQLMECAAASMTEAGGIAFGYLGCREQVVAFYESCGWHRVSAAEHSIDRAGQPPRSLRGRRFRHSRSAPHRAGGPRARSIFAGGPGSGRLC